MVNDNIKNLRENILNLSQDNFAKKIGLQRNTISLIENGKRNPSDRTIKDICKTFNVNENWLLTGNGLPILELNDDEEFLYLVGVFSAEKDEFKKRIIKGMLQLKDRESWELAVRMIEKLAQAEKNNIEK
ncbi:MAG: helix-turn-helix transcriptional regulator [Clostridium sp.]|nr:helix-turn-helix transcriptional regulator [Clostridium sp.]